MPDSRSAEHFHVPGCAPVIESGMLARLMNTGWPALEQVSDSGWLLRASGGVTKRANSVLPLSMPVDVDSAIVRAEDFYSGRGLLCEFQLGPECLPVDLPVILEQRGYREHSRTLVLVGEALTASGTAAGVNVYFRDYPSPAWLELYFGVEGPPGEPEQHIAERIMNNGKAVYATLCAPDGQAVAVGRLALPGDWGGIYCVAVHPDHRRRGWARFMIQQLRAEAHRRGLISVWLQVVAGNRAAVELYLSAGFTEVSQYSYWKRG